MIGVSRQPRMSLPTCVGVHCITAKRRWNKRTTVTVQIQIYNRKKEISLIYENVHPRIPLLLLSVGADAILFKNLRIHAVCNTLQCGIYSKLSDVVGKHKLFCTTVLSVFAFYVLFAFVFFLLWDTIPFLPPAGVHWYPPALFCIRNGYLCQCIIVWLQEIVRCSGFVVAPGCCW